MYCAFLFLDLELKMIDFILKVELKLSDYYILKVELKSIDVIAKADCRLQ